MGLLTKDAMVVRNFLNIRALVKAPISKQAFVYLMVTEGENFARFPTDYDKTLVSLIILYICGSEICFFCATRETWQTTGGPLRINWFPNGVSIRAEVKSHVAD